MTVMVSQVVGLDRSWKGVGWRGELGMFHSPEVKIIRNTKMRTNRNFLLISTSAFYFRGDGLACRVKRDLSRIIFLLTNTPHPASRQQAPRDSIPRIAVPRPPIPDRYIPPRSQTRSRCRPSFSCCPWRWIGRLWFNRFLAREFSSWWIKEKP